MTDTTPTYIHVPRTLYERIVRDLEELDQLRRATKQKVLLLGYQPDKYISVVRKVHIFCHLTLKDAKQLVDSTTVTPDSGIYPVIFEGPPTDVERVAAEFREAGATVEVTA